MRAAMVVALVVLAGLIWGRRATALATGVPPARDSVHRERLAAPAAANASCAAGAPQTPDEDGTSASDE